MVVSGPMFVILRLASARTRKVGVRNKRRGRQPVARNCCPGYDRLAALVRQPAALPGKLQQSTVGRHIESAYDKKGSQH